MTCTKFRGKVTKWKVIESNLNTMTHYSKRDRDRPKSGYLMLCLGNNGERETRAVKPKRSIFKERCCPIFYLFLVLGPLFGLTHPKHVLGSEPSPEWLEPKTTTHLGLFWSVKQPVDPASGEHVPNTSASFFDQNTKSPTQTTDFLFRGQRGWSEKR